MTLPHELLQNFYDISMSIGNSLDVNQMLKESLNAYIDKLGLTAAAVFRLQENISDDYYFQYIYSIPDVLERNIMYRNAVSTIPQGRSRLEAERFMAALPAVELAKDGRQSYLMPLPDFGLLLLISPRDVLTEEILQHLVPLNQKLAKACIGCQNNELLKTEIIIRKHSEKSLVQSEGRLKTIINSVQSGIIIIDTETHTIVDVNPQACKIIGHDKKDVVGKRCYGFICTAVEGECPVTDHNLHIENSERMLINHAGELVPVLETATIVELFGKQHILVSFVDLRETKRAENEKEQLEKMLRQSQKMEAIGTLAGGIAHDFNNLLTPILGLSQLCLEEEIADQSLRESLVEIRNAAHRAKELIEQILTFARRSDEQLVAIKPKNIIKEILRLLRSSLPATIDIRAHIDSDSFILASPTHIQQIVMNLCTNAAQAMENMDGTLTVTLNETFLDDAFVAKFPKHQAGNYLHLEVSDTGVGIPDDISESIFEPYFTTKTHDKGTGFGLTIAHGLITALKGIITFKSTVNSGTTFDVYLPRLRASNAVHPQHRPDIPSGEESILFVDDEIAIVQFGKRLFTKLGYAVTAETSSKRALETFEKNPYAFDLVFTDMTMPEITGDELARAILRVRPDIPIIICTGYSDRITADSAADLGVREIIYKPLIIDDLAVRIRKHLDAR